MKRFKNCTLNCNLGQTTSVLLDEIEITAKKKFRTERYTSFEPQDSLSVYLQVNGLPSSQLIACGFPDKNGVSIVNIIPTKESNLFEINKIDYNKLLDLFVREVFQPICSLHSNTIDEDNEDFTLNEIIPVSFPKLQTWLKGFPLSHHSFDTQRWYDFVIALHKSSEQLPYDIFKSYLLEEYKWDEQVVTDFADKLDSQLDLLEYYDK